MENDDTLKVIFKMEGPAFVEGLPLHIISESLEAVQSIIDKAYLVPQGRERISYEDRKEFFIRSYGISQGSLIAELEIVLNLTAPVLPLISTISPSTIWDYAKLSFQFLKLIFQATKEGKTPRFDIKNNKEVTVHIGDNHYHFNGPVFEIGKASVSSYRKLTEQLGEKSVNNIELSKKVDKKDSAFKMGIADKEIFEIEGKFEKEQIALDCEIFDFNKYENRGRLRVLPGQSVAEGKYSFVVEGHQDNINYIQSMLKPKVELKCIKEMRDDPFSGKVISKLVVLSIINER